MFFFQLLPTTNYSHPQQAQGRIVNASAIIFPGNPCIEKEEGQSELPENLDWIWIVMDTILHMQKAIALQALQTGRFDGICKWKRH